MFLVNVVCYVGRGLCDGPVPRPEKFCRGVVSVCDLETSTVVRPSPSRAVGPQEKW